MAAVKVIECHKISPQCNSVPSTNLPFTYMDAIALLFAEIPMQMAFAFKFPNISTPYFISEILPSLKQSLSLSLQHFFPLAGSVVRPKLVAAPHSTSPNTTVSKPYISYENGSSSVALTVAESDQDFTRLFGTNKGLVIEASELYPLVPLLSSQAIRNGEDNDGGVRRPLLAVQFTIFPNRGICLGYSFDHAVTDGKGLMHFLTMWSTIHKNGPETPVDNFDMWPVIDKTLIADPSDAIQEHFLEQLSSFSVSDHEAEERPVKVRTTIILTRNEIEKLKSWIVARLAEDVEDEEEAKRLPSAFVLSCSLMWVCSVKSESSTVQHSAAAKNCSEDCHFHYVADCRNRFEYRSIVPSTYFGNCIDYGCVVSAKRKDLEGEDGLRYAVKAILSNIRKKKLNRIMGTAKNWISEIVEKMDHDGGPFGISWSPKFGTYGLEFESGRPEKVELVHLDGSFKEISLLESKDDRGGTEIGLALTRCQMDTFISILEDSKQRFCHNSLHNLRPKL